MSILEKMTEEVKQEFPMKLKLKSLKQIKSEGGKHTILKKKPSKPFTTPSYANYIAMKGTGSKNLSQIEHFFATYAHGFSIGGIGTLELILHDKILKWVIGGKENVLVCGSMSGDQMQVAVKNWLKDTYEGGGIDSNWPITEEDVSEDYEPEHEPAKKVNQIEALVKEAVSAEGNDKDCLSSNHEFYDVVSGTSPGSLYVVVGIGKAMISNIAIRYSGTTMSLRCDPAPVDHDLLDTLALVGFKSSTGSHISCHLTILEGDPMKRYFILMRAALDGFFDFCDINIQTIKKKGK